MARYSDTLVDQYGRPVAQALVTVVDSENGQLATLATDDGDAIENPFLTADDGTYYFNAGPDYYDLTFRKGGRVIGQSYSVRVGVPALPAGSIANSLGTSTTVAPSQNAITTGFAASTGLGLSGFIQTGTGATPRTALDKARETVSILDFFTPGDADYTSALQKACDSGAPVYIPRGEYLIQTVTTSNVYIYGPGTLRKKPGTKGFLIDLTGDNRIEGVTFDYDWENADQSLPYYNNVSVDQTGGTLTLSGVKFRRSFLAAVYVLGGSLFTDSGCTFTEGAPHNNLTGGLERTTFYIVCAADADTENQVVSINGGYFEGPSLDPEMLHLNPTGIYVTSNGLDGVRYQTVNISNTVMLGCSTNAGNGNITGAIDTYDGAENVTITGCTIRFYTYAGIKVQNSSNFVVVGNTLNGGYIPTGANTPQSLGIATIEKARGSTIDQRNGVIADNILINSTYTAISNSCDCVVISDNQIAVVQKLVIGTAIYNTGNHVSIFGNMASAIEGVHILSQGNACNIDNNDTESGIGTASSASDAAAYISGSGVKVRNNRFNSTLASPQPCIRTDGPLSSFDILNNDILNFAIGVDLRTGVGTVDSGRVGIQRFISVGLPFNITAGCTNITRDFATVQPGTVAALPASPITGTRGLVTDANSPTFGATVAGGGAVTTPVFFNGTAWKVG